MPNGTRDVVLYDELGRVVADLHQVPQGQLQSHNGSGYPEYWDFNRQHFTYNAQAKALIDTQLHQSISSDLTALLAELNAYLNQSTAHYETQSYNLYLLDANSNLIARLTNGGWSINDFDFGLGNILNQWRIDGNSTGYRWDEVGNLLSQTNPLDANRNRNHAYDDSNRLISTGRQSTNQGLLTYDYDDLGNMTHIISTAPWDEPSVTNTYDSLGRMLTVQANFPLFMIPNKYLVSRGYCPTQAWAQAKTLLVTGAHFCPKVD